MVLSRGFERWLTFKERCAFINDMEPIIFAFLWTLFAGLSTGIGSALAFFAKKENVLFLSVSLGFSAGVMIYVSFMELMPAADKLLAPTVNGQWVSLASFFVGVLFIGLIDWVIPKNENPHEFFHARKDLAVLKQNTSSLSRTGLLTALAVGIHNFPEGFATFMALLQQPSVGISIAVAIALHNIPEGIAVSTPIFYATGNRYKAFWYSFSSGLAEPVGALIGYLLIRPFLNDTVLGCVFGIIAGIMVYISLDELLPTAHKYGKSHHSIVGLFIGMAVMGISLIALN